MNLLNGLNEAQRAAVTAGDGPLLVIAGAGSGKTRVLTYRIAYLLAERKVSPYSILAVTFTNKAAKEMKERVERLVGPMAEAIWVGTFHSTCVQILRREAEHVGYKSNFLIFDTTDQLGVIRESLKELDLDPKNFEPRSLLYAISAAKNELIGPGEFDRRASDYREETIARVYAKYQAKLHENNAFDFDDLIMYTVLLFRHHPDVLQKYQDRFRYILVDEYQDTNHAQYLLVRLLAEKHRNLFVVGDADQSIYSFRGADIRNILEFEQDYPDAKTIKLEQNYRSTQRILDAANGVIVNNIGRKEKNLWTENPVGDPILVCTVPDERAEAAFIAGEIQRLAKEENWSYRDFTILYRTHAQSRALEDELMRRGVPYVVVSGLRFYERKEIKDLIAYLRLIYNQADNYSLRRILNVPRRGIGDATLAKLEAFAQDEGISLFDAVSRVRELGTISARFAKPLEEFAQLIQRLHEAAQSHKVTVTELTEKVLEESGYLRELQNERTEEAEARIENLREFLSVTKQYEEENEPADLAGLLEHVALVSDVDNYDETSDAVKMMTFHAAKGLEFQVVFMVGMEEGVFPHSRSQWEPAELEEERRLCYVGITRAMRKLYLTSARQRTLYGSTTINFPSRFIEEIPSELIEERDVTAVVQPPAVGGKPRISIAPREESQASAKSNGWLGVGSSPKVGQPKPATVDEVNFKPGDKVKHKMFGVGTVVSINSSHNGVMLKIAFPDEGVKTLMAGYAPLEKL